MKQALLTLLGVAIYVLIGLIIGNTLATLSFTLITARIAVDTRLSLYTSSIVSPAHRRRASTRPSHSEAVTKCHLYTSN